MIARFDNGEVSLTTSISEIGLQLGVGVVACNAATPNLLSESDLRHFCQFSRPPLPQQI